MSESRPKTVYFIHPFCGGEVEELKDTFEKKHLEFHCYIGDEDFNWNYLQQREIEIFQADLIVIILTSDLPHDAVTRATLIVAIDQYHSKGKPTVAVTFDSSPWSPTPKDVFIRPDSLTVWKCKKRSDLFSEDFANKVKDTCQRPEEVTCPPKTSTGYGTAWNFALGFLFNVGDKSGVVKDQPVFLPELLRCNWLKNNPDLEGKLSHKIYVVVPYKDATILKECARRVENGSFQVETNYSDQHRTYDLYLHKFRNENDDDAVYATVSVTRTLEPLLADSEDEQDFQRTRINFWTELNRILFSRYSDHFRDHINVILLQPDMEQHAVDEAPNVELERSMYKMISADIESRKKRKTH